MKLLEQLNTAQREAVTTTKGPLLVLAGAGTGKTRVVTFRIVHMIDQGVPPESIVAVTFTNKAAREMQQRVSAMLGGNQDGTVLSTFHSLGMRILRSQASKIGYKSNFTIYDASDQASLVRSLMSEYRGATKPSAANAVLQEISRAKTRFLLPDAYMDEASDASEAFVARIYSRYQERLQTLNCVDFDDLILLPVRVLSENEAVRERYREEWQYLLVDEYQDTNSAQYGFLQQLMGPERNICVVGDDDQSIYAFRGAESERILHFGKDFPGAKVVTLEENYRSTPEILRLANHVIANNAQRHPKALRSTLKTGTPVRVVATPDEIGEVNFVAGEVRSLVQDRAVPGHEIAILLRSAQQARPFEEKLRLWQIPYHLVGGQSYFDRKEIRDVLAYWKVAANPSDDFSLQRVINFPRRGLGDQTVARLVALSTEKKVTLLEAIGLAGEGEGSFSAAARRACRAFHLLMASAREGFERRDFVNTARDLLAAVRYEEALTELYQDVLTRKARWNAVQALFTSLQQWSEQQAQTKQSLAQFLSALALDKPDSKGKKQREDCVCLMTLHAAKGLEFQNVFLVGVEEDLLPHRRSVEDGDRAIEEERRLFYVGITRARQRLTLTQARERPYYGKSRACLLTRFLSELEEEGLYTTDGYNPNQAVSADEQKNFLAAYRERIRDDS